jgi:hypothetical protein
MRQQGQIKRATRPIQLRITTDLYDAMRQRAEELCITVSEFARICIANGIGICPVCMCETKKEKKEKTK